MQWTVCATACADLLSLGPFEPLRAAARVAPLWVCCLGAVPWQLVSDCFSTHGDGTAGRPHSLLVPSVTRFVQCHLPRPPGLSASTTTKALGRGCSPSPVGVDGVEACCFGHVSAKMFVVGTCTFLKVLFINNTLLCPQQTTGHVDIIAVAHSIRNLTNAIIGFFLL